MSDLPKGLSALNLDPEELETLKPWAQLFDQYTHRNPPRPGDRYTALEFVEWLLLEQRSRSREQVTERRRDERQIRSMNRAMAS